MTDVTDARTQLYREVIQERLGLTVDDANPDPLIDLHEIARLAGVQHGTPKQWRGRTKLGQAKHPFPEPIPGEGDRFPRKPMWRVMSQVIPYLEVTGNWPPERGARPATRGPRMIRQEAEAA